MRAGAPAGNTGRCGVEIQDLVTMLEEEPRVAVLSGAGISAASGIPTFRGEQDSLWSRYRPEELATPQAFAADPELVWRWYDWRRGLIAAAEPNAAHHALARLATRTEVVIVTQNVDGYHQQAGSGDVLEYHGSIWQVRCTGCGATGEDRRVPLPVPPRCDICDGLLRPGVVWFGEGIDPAVAAASERAVGDCDLFLVIGTAGAVYPAAGLVTQAGRAGARVVEFNLAPSGVSHHADLFVAGSAADTLGSIVP
ncbi:MAG: NAD-dependent deacylase [bacterium]|nr:NAD-dependent deacylase [bacterium]